MISLISIVVLHKSLISEHVYITVGGVGEHQVLCSMFYVHCCKIVQCSRFETSEKKFLGNVLF